MLSNKKYLIDGSFPSSKDEVLVNKKYFYDNYDCLDLTGNETVILKDKEYRIVGILTDNQSLLHEIYDTNIYYNDSDLPQVFLTYDAIQEISEKKLGDYVMATISDLYTNNDLYDELLDLYIFNCWKNKIENITYSLNLFVDLFFVALSVLSVISFIFIANQIILTLYYKKREFGYLQLFGISKKRIKKMVLYEYLYKYIFSLILSIIIYIILSVVISYILQVKIYIPLIYF